MILYNPCPYRVLHEKTKRDLERKEREFVERMERDSRARAKGMRIINILLTGMFIFLFLGTMGVDAVIKWHISSNVRKATRQHVSTIDRKELLKHPSVGREERKASQRLSSSRAPK